MSAEELTTEDVRSLIADLAAAYCRRLGERELSRMSEVWYEHLRFYARHHVRRAVRSLRTEPDARMPSLGHVVRLAAEYAAAARHAEQVLNFDDGICPQCGTAWYAAGFLLPTGQVLERMRCACAHYDAPHRPYEPDLKPRAGVVYPEPGFNRWSDPRASGGPRSVAAALLEDDSDVPF